MEIAQNALPILIIPTHPPHPTPYICHICDRDRHAIARVGLISHSRKCKDKNKTTKLTFLSFFFSIFFCLFFYFFSFFFIFFSNFFLSSFPFSFLLLFFCKLLIAATTSYTEIQNNQISPYFTQLQFKHSRPTSQMMWLQFAYPTDMYIRHKL